MNVNLGNTTNATKKAIVKTPPGPINALATLGLPAMAFNATMLTNAELDLMIAIGMLTMNVMTE